MIDRKAWFCPSCQKHHAPHCDTCPEVVQVRPLPGITVPFIPPSLPPYWVPDPASTPWTPVYTGTGTIMDGAAMTRGVIQ
jgi:hypothetical protein